MMNKQRKTIAILLSLIMVILPFSSAFASCCDPSSTDMVAMSDMQHDHNMMVDMNMDDDSNCQSDLSCHCVSSALVSNMAVAASSDERTSLIFQPYPSFTNLNLSQDSPPPKA